MRQRFGVWLWAAASVLFLTILSWPVSAEDKTGSEKVAVVNGDIITRADLDRAVNVGKKQAMYQGAKNLSDEQIATIKKEALDKLIGIELLYQASKKEGNKVDQKQVDEKFEEYKKRFPNTEEYDKALKEWNVTEAGVKAELKKGMITEAFVIKNFVDKTKVPEGEAKAYYDSHPQFFKQPEQVRASHILIKIEPNASDADKAKAKKKIEEIQEKLIKGEDFAEVAKTSSEGPSAGKGGDLGYFGRGQMVKPFEETAFSMEPGSVSDVVETKFGYHLIKVVDKKPESLVPFDTVKPRIEQFLQQKAVQEKIKEYIDKLRKEANIEIFSKDAS